MGYKIPIIKGVGFSFAIEPYPNQIFVHCEVTSLKPSVIKEMLQKWKGFRESTTIDFYALHNDEKNVETHKHFLKMFGFKYQQMIPAKEGKELFEIWMNKGTQK